MIDYSEVAGDLRQRAGQLILAAQVIEGFIGDTEKFKADDAVQPSRRATKKFGPRKTKPESEPLKDEAPKQETPKQPTISDLIRQVAAETIERTSTEICDRVKQLRPNCDKANMQTIMWQLIHKGELRKTDDLKVRPVIDGIIQRGKQ